MHANDSTVPTPTYKSNGSGKLAPMTLWLALGLCGNVHAQEPPPDTHATPPGRSTIDRFHASMTVSANDAARWFDSFFEDERYIAEEATSRIRLRPSLLLEEGRSARFRFSVGARINVPHFNRKLKLVLSGEDDTLQDNLDSQRFTTTDGRNADETNIGLQYILREKAHLNTHIAAGVKIGGNHIVDLFIGPRLRTTWHQALWQLRFTERVRWYTDIGWESRTRFDLERVVGTAWFFRGTIDARLRQEDYNDSGLRYDISPTLTQKLRDRAAIEYQWNTGFVTRPAHRLQETGLRVRFRKQIWRDWLFYEINPQLVFRNDDDFRATPGIEFRLEASFGGLDDKLPDS